MSEVLQDTADSVRELSSGPRARGVSRALWNAAAPLRDLAERLAGTEALDAVAGRLPAVVGRIVPPGSELNTVLSGTWLGHPLHPVLTDVTIGSLTSAVALDWLGGPRGARGADRLIVLGLLSAVPTALSGMNDGATINTPERRIASVHAAANTVASGLFAMSWWRRKRGRRMTGRLLALAGLAATTLGGTLGGDLSFRRGSGVDHTRFAQGGREWTEVAEESALAEDQPVAVQVDDLPVVLVRHAGRIAALAARCAHQGGPLQEGAVRDDCLVCPWHGSTFRLADGAAVTGPSAHPQPTLQVRVREGKIELRR